MNHCPACGVRMRPHCKNADCWWKECPTETCSVIVDHRNGRQTTPKDQWPEEKAS